MQSTERTCAAHQWWSSTQKEKETDEKDGMIDTAMEGMVLVEIVVEVDDL